MKKTLIALGLIVVAAFALAFRRDVSTPPTGNLPTGSISVDKNPPGRVLPDPKLTPGAVNPDITEANKYQTICNPAWSTKSIRPASSYTTALKKKQIVQYGYKNTDTASYEEDHLISLELGGNPTDPKNLWPQPYAAIDKNVNNRGAKVKDSVENFLHKQVCSGHMTLKDAQGIISTDWTRGLDLMNSGKLGAVYVDDSDPDDE